jgi:hypothetical protein
MLDIPAYMCGLPTMTIRIVEPKGAFAVFLRHSQRIGHFNGPLSRNWLRPISPSSE